VSGYEKAARSRSGRAASSRRLASLDAPPPRVQPLVESVGDSECRARLTAARHGPLRFGDRVPQHRSVSLSRFGFSYHTPNAQGGNGISRWISQVSRQPGRSSAGTSTRTDGLGVRPRDDLGFERPAARWRRRRVAVDELAAGTNSPASHTPTASSSAPQARSTSGP
jgi:hypothetical protein